MIVQLLCRDGNRIRPLVLSVTQVVVRQDNGTPTMVAAEYGPDDTQAISKVGDDDFNTTLQNLGIHDGVVCDTILLPPPPTGARLLAGPRLGERNVR